MIERIDLFTIRQFEKVVSKIHALTGRNSLFLARGCCIVFTLSNVLTGLHIPDKFDLGVVVPLWVCFYLFVFPRIERRVEADAEKGYANSEKVNGFGRFMRVMSFLFIATSFIRDGVFLHIVSFVGQSAVWVMWVLIACDYLPPQKNKIRDWFRQTVRQPESVRVAESL